MIVIRFLTSCGRALGAWITQTILWVCILSAILLAIPLGFAYLVTVSIIICVIGLVGSLLSPRKNCRIAR